MCRHFIPRCGFNPPTAWRPREYNVAADALANLGFAHISHKRVLADITSLRAAKRLQIHSDGWYLVDLAQGSYGVAFTAWQFDDIAQEPTRNLEGWMCGGFTGAAHSLHAELFALRCALQFVREQRCRW